LSQSGPTRLTEAVFLLTPSKLSKEVDYLPKTFNDVGVIKNIQIFCFPKLQNYHTSNSANSDGQQLYGLCNEFEWLYHTFVLTNQTGSRIYCHCLR
jgi:hypothetical protein